MRTVLCRCVAAAPVLFALLLGAPASANPIPMGAAMVDVSPAVRIVSSCDELAQHSFDSGPLYFTVYAYPRYFYALMGEYGIGSMTGAFSWPEGWSLLDVQLLTEGTLEPSGPNGFEWPDCPQYTDPLTLIPMARFLLDVTSEGRLMAACEDVLLCYPGEEPFPEGFWGVGYAGLECAYCDTRCDLRLSNEIAMNPEVLELTADEQGHAVGEIEADLYWWNTQEFYAHATEDWLTTVTQMIDDDEFLIVVTADGSSLGPGVHEGFVVGESGCVKCSRVIFTVLQPTATESTSWGRVKTLYRK